MEWCKKRALEYVANGDIHNGLVSMMSDLKKHPETEHHSGIMLTAMLMMNGNLKTTDAATKHINGFN